MVTTEDAPRNPFQVLEGRHGLAQIVERGAGVVVEHRRVILSHLERDLMTVTENASRHRQRSKQQCFSFFEAPYIKKV